MAFVFRCIIWNYDIYGFDQGRSKQMADLLAQKGNNAKHGLQETIPTNLLGSI